MVYAAGKTDHTVRSEEMVEHIVSLVEARAERMVAEKRAADEPERQAAE